MRPHSLPYRVFVEAPSDLDALQGFAGHFDPYFEMLYRDNGIEFKFTNRVAAVQFLFASLSQS
jgi:hypothetical protein